RYQVKGQVYAQPLLVQLPLGNRVNILYVATMHNLVFAFNADPPFDLIWETPTPLKPSIRLPDPEIGNQPSFLKPGYRNILEEVGILSTPVASPEHNALYLVLATKERDVYSHFLYALDLTTGNVKPNFPVRIEGDVTLS